MHSVVNVSQGRVWRKVAWRILPFLLVLYVMSYLDRTNVAFARFPMSADLGFSERVYGIGSGLFFVGYFLLGIPGALIVERWGARLLVGCAAIAWGVATFTFIFLKTPAEFFVLRFLLGVSAAPFFPGVIVHIARWFPLRDRPRALAGFVTAAPVSLTIGGPLAGLMLQLHGFGIRSWQWIFLIEGLLTIVLGVVALFVLDDTPRDARWLTSSERETVFSELEAESRATAGAAKTVRWWTVWRQANILLLCVAHAFANIAGYGFVFWLPSAIKSTLGASAAGANSISAIPFGLSAITLWLMARFPGRSDDLKRRACFPMLAAAFFFFATLVPGQPAPLMLVWISLTGACIFAWIPGFWAMPTVIAIGPARAASIGLINSIGNLGGFLGPAIIGELLAETHSNKALPLLVASSYCAAALLVSLVPLKPAR